jgi:hypothetical protein
MPHFSARGWALLRSFILKPWDFGNSTSSFTLKIALASAFSGVPFLELFGYRHGYQLRRIPVRVEAIRHGIAIFGEARPGNQRCRPQVSGFPILDVRAASPMLPSQTPRPRSPTHDPLRKVCEVRQGNAQRAQSAKRSSRFPVKVLSDPERRFFWIS